MSACPSAATLARLGLDSIRDEASSTLEDHIAACPDCQDELDRLMRNDAAGPSTPELPTRDDSPTLPGFAIERELGRGSTGVVYLARQSHLARSVALKVVRSGPEAGSRERARWIREARSFSRLRHENVVRLHEIGEAEGWLYLVLEYIPGGTLADRLKVPYVAADAARLIASIAEAVEAIHRAGLLHLDLKPSNILMDAPPGAPREQATPRVGDFGLAFAWCDPETTSATIGTGCPVGTPGYMAPEQVGNDRDRLGPAADVHGLGALLYHAITGRPPFAAPTLTEILEQVRDQDPVPPRRLNPGIPRDLETICLKCLRKDPARRYDSAGAVADDLRRFLDGAPISARPASALERAGRWCRRRPAIAAMAAALILATSGGFLGMFALWRQAEAHRGRAEAYFGRAAALLGELIDLNAGESGRLPGFVDPVRKIDLLQGARRHLVELADQLPDRRAYYTQLMAVDQGLAGSLAEESRRDELRDVLVVTLRDAEEARRIFPRDVFSRVWEFWALHQLAEFADRDGKPSVVQALHSRAVALAEDSYSFDASSGQLDGLIRGRWKFAADLATAGRIGEVRAILRANRQTLAEVPPNRVGPFVVAMRAAAPIVERQLGIELPPWPGRTSGLGSSEVERLPPDAWAEAAAHELGLDDPNGPTASSESWIAYGFADTLRWIGSDQRRRKQRDRAQQSADRLMALARRMLRKRGDEAFTYLLLADAHEQANKNAWRDFEDPSTDPEHQPAIRATIEKTLRQSIDANRLALELAPSDIVARKHLEVRQRKLEKFLHPSSR